MKIKILLLNIMALFSTLATAQVEQFESLLKSKSGEINSIKCHFTQVQEIAVLANTVKKSGEFYFLRPSNMLLSFSVGDYIMMTEQLFSMRSAGSVTTTKVASNPMLKSLNAILSACVMGDFQQMTRGFAINVEQKSKEWVVTMTPQHGKAASKVSRIVICFDSNDMSLNTLTMEEKSGGYTKYSFSNKQFNTTIDSKLFDIAK